MSETQSKFILWMQSNFNTGQLYPAFHCYSWRIRGVLITLWMRNGVVKVYHKHGRKTRYYMHYTELCRDAIRELSQQPAAEAIDKESIS